MQLLHTEHSGTDRLSKRERRAGIFFSQSAARQLDTDLVALPLPRNDLPDAKQSWLLSDLAGKPRAVAQLSSPTSPSMVSRGVTRAAAVRGRVGSSEGLPILSPISVGTYEGGSYALWPYCEPLPHGRQSFFARRALVRPVFDWLSEIARQTARRVPVNLLAEQVDRPLCRLATSGALTTRTRLAARAALRRLDRGAFRPMQVATHGDLHQGNLLLDRQRMTGRHELPDAERFVVIDWCGASVAGYPLFDLLRAAESLRIADALLAAELSVHCALLGGDLQDAVPHAAVALADLHVHLEHFPLECFATLAERVLARLDAALISTGGS